MLVYQRVNLVGITWLKWCVEPPLPPITDDSSRRPCGSRCFRRGGQRVTHQDPLAAMIISEMTQDAAWHSLTHVHWCFHMVIKKYVYIYIYIYIYIIYHNIYIHSFSIDVSIDVFHMLHQVHRKDDPEPTPEPTAEATADAEEPAMEVPLWKKNDRDWFRYIYIYTYMLHIVSYDIYIYVIYIYICNIYM